MRAGEKKGGGVGVGVGGVGGLGEVGGGLNNK